jgi:hypothetical protein
VNLRIAVAHQEPERLDAVTEIGGEGPGALRHPLPRWMAGNTQQMHAASTNLDHKEHVNPAKQDGVDVREVASRTSLRPVSHRSSAGSSTTPPWHPHTSWTSPATSGGTPPRNTRSVWDAPKNSASKPSTTSSSDTEQPANDPQPLTSRGLATGCSFDETSAPRRGRRNLRSCSSGAYRRAVSRSAASLKRSGGYATRGAMPWLICSA